METGISKENLDIFIRTIEEYSNKLKSNLNDYEEIIEKSKEYFKSDLSSDFYNKVNTIYESNKKICNNISQYALDLKNLEEAYQNHDKEVARQISSIIIKEENNASNK